MTPSLRSRLCASMAAPLLLLSANAFAAGHMDVDDPFTMAPGECQFETWAGRASGDRDKLWHLGPACQVGPVQLGLNVDGAHVPGERALEVGVSMKWNFLGGSESVWSAGLSGAVTFDAMHGGRQGGQLLLPVAWHPHERLWVYGNIGSDWSTGSGVRTERGGLGIEWALMPERLSFVAERNKAGDEWTSRAGLRYHVSPQLNIDATVSRVDGTHNTGFVIGLHYGFGGSPALAPTALSPRGASFAQR